MNRRLRKRIELVAVFIALAIGIVVVVWMYTQPPVRRCRIDENCVENVRKPPLRSEGGGRFPFP